jgi:hypothetical protein
MSGIDGSGLYFCLICHAFHERNLPSRSYSPGQERKYPVVPNTRSQFLIELEKRPKA